MINMAGGGSRSAVVVLQEFLRGRGLRMTAERKALLEVALTRRSHFTLDELAQAESLAQPSADLAMEQGQVFEERREFDRALQAYQHLCSGFRIVR